MIALYALAGLTLLLAASQPYLGRVGDRRLRAEEARLRRSFECVQAGLLARVYGGCTCVEGILTDFEHHESHCEEYTCSR